MNSEDMIKNMIQLKRSIGLQKAIIGTLNEAADKLNLSCKETVKADLQEAETLLDKVFDKFQHCQSEIMARGPGKQNDKTWV